MPAFKEIFFACPTCAEPLVARAHEAGKPTDCPHCFESIAVPASPQPPLPAQFRFQEPPRLRRILMEVRDKEWEAMRRNLQQARARIAELEQTLQTIRAGSSQTLASA